MKKIQAELNRISKLLKADGSENYDKAGKALGSNLRTVLTMFEGTTINLRKMADKIYKSKSFEASDVESILAYLDLFSKQSKKWHGIIEKRKKEIS